MESHGEALGRVDHLSQPHRPRATAKPAKSAQLSQRRHESAGWATPDQVASRLDLPYIARPFTSIWSLCRIAYVVRDTVADHPGLTAPARIIGTRSQGEAENAIEQGETGYEGVTWTTPRQRVDELVPSPEPARRGLINVADDVVATTNQAVAAALNSTPAMSPDQPGPVNERISGVPSSRIRSPTG